MTDYEGSWAERNIYEGLPGWLSQIYVRKSHSGYTFVFFGYRQLFGRSKYPSRVTGRRRRGYFGDLRLDQLTPDLILSKFPRALQKLEGEWLAHILRAEISKKAAHRINEDAIKAYQGLDTEEKTRLKAEAMAMAGPQGYTRDPRAILFLTKRLMELGVPIKNRALIGRLMLGMAEHKV